MTTGCIKVRIFWILSFLLTLLIGLRVGRNWNGKIITMQKRQSCNALFGCCIFWKRLFGQ